MQDTSVCDVKRKKRVENDAFLPHFVFQTSVFIVIWFMEYQTHQRAGKTARPESVRIVRAEMTRRGVTYEELCRLLHSAGVVVESQSQLRRKIARGTFSFSFFLDVMRAMSVSTISLEPIDTKRN